MAINEAEDHFRGGVRRANCNLPVFQGFHTDYDETASHLGRRKGAGEVD